MRKGAVGIFNNTLLRSEEAEIGAKIETQTFVDKHKGGFDLDPLPFNAH